MSITLGIYDFYSYIIPGLLYLYAINEFLRAINWKFINLASWLQLGQTPNLILLIAWLIIAFIVGHIFNPLAKDLFDFVFRLRHRRGDSETSLMSIKDRYPDLKIQFGPKDWSTLFVLIRVRDLELSKFIDKFNADAIMLRNIAFGLVLLLITYFIEFFMTGAWIFLISAILALIFCSLAVSRSDDFRTRFFKHIYRASLEYGVSLKEVVEYNYNKPRKRNNQPLSRT